MDGMEFKDLSLIGRIKMILREATERKSDHDFSTDMSLRAQHTAELYQIIDGISKDESKLEILKAKQRLRDRIQEMENDIKAQVSQLLAEEAMEKSKKTIEKVQKKPALKPSLKVSQGTHHSLEIHSKLSPRTHVPSSLLYQKCENQHNVVTSQNLEHRACSLLPCPYPSKQYVLPLHSCSCLQNAYFYPLAQPSRIRKEELTRTNASFTDTSKVSRLSSAENIYLERGNKQLTMQDGKFSRNVDANQIEKRQFYDRVSQHGSQFKPHEETSGIGSKGRKNLFPEPPQMTTVIESKAMQKSEVKKKYKNKCIQTDKHITWSSSRRKSKEKSRESHKNVLSKSRHNYPTSTRNSYAPSLTRLQRVTKDNALVDASATLNATHDERESAIKSHNTMNDYLSGSIKQLQARAELMYNRYCIDNSAEFNEVDASTQTLDNSSILDLLNRLVSNARNEEDIVALYSVLSSIQETTNALNLENHSSDSGASINKDLLEKLIVDVLYEDLQGLSDQEIDQPERDVHTESSDTEEHSAEPEDLENLDTKQHLEQEESELPPATEQEESELPPATEKVVTPELSPQISLPSSTSSSPSSSPSLNTKPLPATPSLSEQESTSEEIPQQSRSVEFKRTVHSVPTPDLTPPQSCSPKHHIATPPLSPQPANVSESVSSDKGIKKSVQDASVQVSKVNSSGESTLGTVATSISDTTDDFLSDGELLLKHYGHSSFPAHLDKEQKKSRVTIQDHPDEKVMPQISLSEGELPLLKAEGTAFDSGHQFQIMDSNIDETHFPIPTNSTFEQIWEDISEGQIIPQHLKRNFKPLHLNQTSNTNEMRYCRQLSNTLSEGEISALYAAATPFKSPTYTKQDDLSGSAVKDHLPNSNLSVSSGEIENDEKLSKSVVADGEDPEVFDAEFFDDDKETIKEQD